MRRVGMTVTAIEGIDEWSQVGEKLRGLDPQRFSTLLDIARKVVLAYEDPMSRAFDESSDDGAIVVGVRRGSA